MTTSYLPHDPLPSAVIGPFMFNAIWTIEDHIACNDGQSPPAMFSRFELLQAWAKNKDIEVRKIGRRSMKNVCLLINDHRGVERYEAVWVRVCYTRYRDALLDHIKKRYIPRGFIDEHGIHDLGPTPRHIEEMSNALKYVHADHVINRARLRAHKVDAWVMVLPVVGRSNSSFGSIVERKFEPIDASTTQTTVDLLTLIKLYTFAGIPRDPQNFEKFISMINAIMVDHPHKKGMIAEIVSRYAKLTPAVGEFEPGSLSSDELPPEQRWESIEWKL